MHTTLRDGTPALIWPLLPTDRYALREAFDELSPTSRRQRFLGTLRQLSEPMLHLLVDTVDGVEHIALVLTAMPAEDATRPVGVGRLVRYTTEPAVADIAVTVAEDWRGRGVATALVRTLLTRRPPEVTALRTLVAHDNAASLALLSRYGRTTTGRDAPGVLQVEVHDLPPAQPGAESSPPGTFSAAVAEGNDR